MPVCLVANFVVFATTLPRNKKINLRQLDKSQQGVQIKKQYLVIQHSQFTIKISQKGSFNVFAKDTHYCYTNLRYIVKTITRFIQKASNIPIQKCYYQIKNLQFHGKLQTDDCTELLNFVKQLESNKTIQIKDITVEQPDCDIYHAKSILNFHTPNFSKIEINLQYNNKKGSLIIHFSGKLTGVCPGINSFLSIAEEIEKINKDVP